MSKELGLFLSDSRQMNRETVGFVSDFRSERSTTTCRLSQLNVCTGSAESKANNQNAI